MKCLICLLSLLFVSIAWGSTEAVIRASSVKIVSKIIATGREYRGSGLLFSQGGKRYVITSDHVAFHISGSLADQHATASESGENLTLAFIAAEWGNGLALFSVENDTTPGPALPFSEMQSAKAPVQGAPASLLGYPFESTQLDEETGGKIAQTTSRQPFFFLAPDLIELTATVGEFGMSGGPVFSSQSEFLGILSYQKMQPGSENRLYAIPASIVTGWIEDYLKEPAKFLPYFSEPWWGQGQIEDAGLILTNDNVLLGFRAFNGIYRYIATSLQAPEMVLSDRETKPYVDARNLWPALRAQVQSDKLRPVEYGLIKTSGGSVSVLESKFPAEIFEASKDPSTSFFVATGQKHEERYAKIQAAVLPLKEDAGKLSPILSGQPGPEVKAFLDGLQHLQDSFAAAPAQPLAPGPEGAILFFSVKWLSDFYFDAQALETSTIWDLVSKSDPALSAKAKRDLEAIRGALDVRLIPEKG